MHGIDEIDNKLLMLLNKNARMPLKDLSAKVFLTTPAVSARVEKLENLGYITGYHAAMDLEKLGYIVKAFIMLTVSPEDSKNFAKFIKDEKNVLECYHITGPYSMLLKVTFKTTSLLDGFLGKLQVYGKTETQVVFSAIIEKGEMPV